MKELVINRNDAGQRLDKYLTKAVPALPPALLHKYLRRIGFVRAGYAAAAAVMTQWRRVSETVRTDAL